jgi:hypothetical protein
MIADWATFPFGINDRGVPVLEKYHGRLVCEHADGSFCELAQTVLRLNRIREQKSKKERFSGYSVGSTRMPGYA